MIEIRDKKLCCGCNVCGDVCPNSAISFVPDNEGFLYPVVDANACKNCGACEKVCPVLNLQIENEQTECYAAENKDMEAIFESSSGGIFSIFAKYFYRQGGYVAGAIYDENFSVVQFVSNNGKDISRLRSAKYSQSDSRGFYKKVHELLKNGEHVLVCGTPCQIAGLRAYIGGDFENLLTVDFVCGGVCSPLVWKKYVAYINEHYNSPAEYIKADCKEFGWSQRTYKAILKDGRHIYEPKKICAFTKTMEVGALQRPSCYDCKISHVSDITLGNFEEIKNFSPKMCLDLGRSLVIVRSEKGRKIFDALKQRMNFASVPNTSGKIENSRRLSEKDREKFFRDIQEKPFVNVMEECARTFEVKTFREKVKATKIGKLLLTGRLIARITRFNFSALYKTIKYSGIKNLLHNKGIIFAPNCNVTIAKSAVLELNDILIVGMKRGSPHNHTETFLYMGENTKLSVMGRFTFIYGNIVSIHDNGHLILRGCRHGNSEANFNVEIQCGELIDIGYDVAIGYKSAIQDINHHYIGRTGYKRTRPVIIENKAWLCNSCTIMPGVKIGEGAIVGAKSFVVSSVPAHAMVSGHPAKVIDRNILWKL